MANVVSGHILAVYPHTFDLSIRPMRVGGKTIEGDSFSAPDSDIYGLGKIQEPGKLNCRWDKPLGLDR